MPYLFAGSAAAAAGWLGMLALPPDRARPAAQLAMLGAAAELTAEHLLERRLGTVAEPYHAGPPGALMRTAKVLTACGLGTAVLARARRSRALSVLAGATMMTASAVTRFGVFEAGLASARDPKYTVEPQRERVTQRDQAAAPRASPLPPWAGRGQCWFQRSVCGQPGGMLKRLVLAAAAGAAGTTALNAVTYLDMVPAAPPVQRHPRADRDRTGQPQRPSDPRHRAGSAAPAAGPRRAEWPRDRRAPQDAGRRPAPGRAAARTGARVRRAGPVPAMLASDLALTRPGSTDPPSWDAVSWASDAVPHLAHGAATYGALAAWK